MPAFVRTRLPPLLLRFGLHEVAPPSAPRIFAALLVAAVLPAVSVFALRRSPRGGVPVCLFFYGMYFWNALLPHIPLTLLLESYTPGVLTAAFVNLPLSLYLFTSALKEGRLTAKGLATLLGLSLVVYPLAVFLLVWAPRLPLPG